MLAARTRYRGAARRTKGVLSATSTSRARQHQSGVRTHDTGHRTVEWHPRDRSGSPSGRTALRADTGPPGRGSHQDRTHRRRGNALPRAMGAQTERLLGAGQQRQEEREHGLAQGRGEGGLAQADQSVGRVRTELSPWHHRRDGLRVRGAESAEPAHHHGERLGIRAIRPVSRPDRLRPHRPDHVRYRHGHGRRGHAADSRGGAYHRPHYSAALGHRYARRPLREKHIRRGTDHRRVPGGLGLQPDRDPRQCLSRHRRRTEARGRQVGSKRHVPVCRRLGPDFRWRRSHVAARVRRSRQARLGGKIRASPGARIAPGTLD